MSAARSLPLLLMLVLLVLLPAMACATLGTPGKGDVDLPSAGVGPFRKLEGTELLGVAPFVLDDKLARFRDPAVIALEDDEASSKVAIFAVAREKGGGEGDVIVRSRADDARSFFGTGLDLGHTPPVVLRADAAWEGTGVRAPSAVRVGDRVLLYYAADNGIGVATSDDGLHFAKVPGPIFARDEAIAWETTPPAEPSVARYPDGRWRMLYASGAAIGEAESDDMVHWRRVSAAPILAPSAPVDPASLAPGERGPFDTARVGDPCLLPRVTAAGRLHIRVLYTGTDATGATTIGFAARYGDQGALEKQPAPVYAVGKHEAAPALFTWSGGAMLYVTQDRADSSNAIYPAVAAAFAPPTESLGTPTSYADGP
jgi:hypothetical protein